MKSLLIGTGLSGFIGSRIVELLESKFVFTDFSLSGGVDITDTRVVDERIRNHPGSTIIHLAAKASVDGCEADKHAGKAGEAWRINVIGTENIANAAARYKKKVIYISTDFVFDGTEDFYTETSVPNPINWYGVTKYEAEKIVLASSSNLVVRIAYPYQAINKQKKDFVHLFLEKLVSQSTVFALSDHYFTPTFVDDLANTLAVLIDQKAIGIYHVVGSTSLTPYEAAVAIAAHFRQNGNLIRPILRNAYFEGRARRPYKLRLKNDKITSLGSSLKTFTKGLEEVSLQGLTV